MSLINSLTLSFPSSSTCSLSLKNKLIMFNVKRKAYFVSLFERSGSKKPLFSIEHLEWLLEDTIYRYNEGEKSLAEFVPIGVQLALFPISVTPKVIILTHGLRHLFITVLEKAEEKFLNQESIKSNSSFKLFCELLSCTAGVAPQSLQNFKIRLTSLCAAKLTYLFYSAFKTPICILDLDLVALKTIPNHKPCMYPLNLAEILLGQGAISSLFKTTANSFVFQGENASLFSASSIMNIFGQVRISIAAYEASTRVCILNNSLVFDYAFLDTSFISQDVLVSMVDFSNTEILLRIAKEKTSQSNLEMNVPGPESDSINEGIFYTRSKSKRSILVQNMNYRDQLMLSNRQVLQILFIARGQKCKCRGEVCFTKEKTTCIRILGDGANHFRGSFSLPIITEINCLGREDYSLSEIKGIIWRRDLLKSSSKARNDLSNGSLIRPLLLDCKEFSSDGLCAETVKAFEYMALDDYNVIKERSEDGSLNKSQVRAAMAILSPCTDDIELSSNGVAKTVKGEDRVVLIHGPPGTGKTSLAAACCQQFVASYEKYSKPINAMNKISSTIFACCQSNVAVKNIALSLAKRNIKFKIIVCESFYVWHKDLYAGISDCLIISDRLPDNNWELLRLFSGCNVILSTVAFLSSARMELINNIFQVSLLMIDEASQIHVRHYPHLLSFFGKTLGRVVFLGDDKQLAPFNSEDIEEAGMSVFEVPHLRQRAIMLDTTYRLPVPQTKFISETVYDGKLKSGSKNFDPKAGIVGCVSFIDVDSGKEGIGHGRSRFNSAEAAAVVSLVKEYHRFGFDLSDLKVLTPYNAQRSLLEAELMRHGFCRNADMVFTVDSFQGHECGYVILSLVRDGHKTEKRESKRGSKNQESEEDEEEEEEAKAKHFQHFHLGFLNNDRRTNVALTRNKHGLIIVSSKRFLEGKGCSNLFGKLDQFVKASKEEGETAHWITERDALNGNLAPHIFCRE